MKPEDLTGKFREEWEELKKWFLEEMEKIEEKYDNSESLDGPSSLEMKKLGDLWREKADNIIHRAEEEQKREGKTG